MKPGNFNQTLDNRFDEVYAFVAFIKKSLRVFCFPAIITHSCFPSGCVISRKVLLSPAAVGLLAKHRVIPFSKKGVYIVSEMKDRNKALVRRIYEELWNQGNLSVAREIFAQPEGVERFVQEFLSAFPNLQHTVEDMIAEGDQVVARFSAQGTQTGPWRQYPASGNRIQYTGVTIASIEGDKIIHHQTWWDMMEVVEQITGESS